MFNSFIVILAAINPFVIGVIVIVALGFLIWTLFTYTYGSLWLQARLSGAPIAFVELIGMTLRKVDAKTIVTCRITVIQAGMELSITQLESHYLAGGNVPNVVRAMIALDRAGINPGWETLTREDLQGIDVLDEAQYAIQRTREDENDYDGQCIEEDGIIE